MKKIIFILLSAASLQAGAQKMQSASFDGIGDLKLGMTIAEVESLLSIKIKLKHINIDERYTETINAKYNGIPVQIDLMKSHDEKDVARVEGLATSSVVVKFSGGIGVGTDKQKLLSSFQDQMLFVDAESKAGPPNIKLFASDITVADIDNKRSAIIFSLLNKKVRSIWIGPTPQFRDQE